MDGGGVIDSNGFVPESEIPGTVGGDYPHEEPSFTEPVKVAFLGHLINHWGHFLIDMTTRLWYLLENDGTIDKYVFITESKNPFKLTGNYKEFFDLLGVADKIEIIDKPKKYKSVVVPEVSFSGRQRYYSLKFKKIFDTVAGNALKKPLNLKAYDKIFLTRSGFEKAKKSESGLLMLDDYFGKNGYKIIRPEKISLSELIFYLRNANVCAACSGTPPHNFLFCGDGQKVEIVERQPVANNVQINVDLIKNLDATYVDANYYLLPVHFGGGPFIYGYTDCFKEFTKDNNYFPPDEKFLNKKELAHDLRRYYFCYKKNYLFTIGIEDWLVYYADSMYQTYAETKRVFGDFLNEKEPFTILQYFTIRRYKEIAKKILKKLKLYD